MKRIPWDKYEKALLIEAYQIVVTRQKNRTDAVKDLSDTLRKRAVSLGLTIDDSFRNYNGISCRFGELDFLFSNGENGISHTSRMFKDMVLVFQTEKELFQRILTFAKAIIVYPEGYYDEYQKMISLLDDSPSGNEFATHEFLEKIFS